MPERLTPILGTAALLLIAVVWRAWTQRRRHGGWGIVLFRNGWGQHLRDGALLVFAALLIGQAIAAAFGRAPASFVPAGDYRSAFAGAGAALMIEGLALIIIAQRDLGASWRIGIEEGAKPGLVTKGFYGWCRNPIFFSMFVWMLGYTLALFTPLSLILMFGFYGGVRLQVGAEEAYLLRVYGDDYRAYARRVGRFMPHVGRMR
jgi:protein-S-isoprenylcysteine O-methyltransferase Ste14